MASPREVELDRTFAALADPTRRAILRRLARGEASAGALAEPFTVSLPAISRHLRVLEAAGLLVRQKVGREHRCRLDPKPIRASEAWMSELRDFWSAQFDALAAFLECDAMPTRNAGQRPGKKND